MASTAPTNYFKEKLLEYPAMNASELDLYLKKKERLEGPQLFRERSFLFDILPFLYNLLNSNGKFSFEMEEKLNAIRAINENIIYVLRNPGMEELIQSSKERA